MIGDVAVWPLDLQNRDWIQIKNLISTNFQHFRCHFIAFLKQFKHLTVWATIKLASRSIEKGWTSKYPAMISRWFFHTFRAFRGKAVTCCDKLRSAQNPWFASCGTSLHVSKYADLGLNMNSHNVWSDSKNVRLVSVLLRKNIFLRTLNPSSSYRYKKHHHFVTKNFTARDLIDNSSFSSSFHHRQSEIWVTRPQELKDFRQVSNGDAVARPQCRQTQQWTAPLVVSFCLGMWHCGMENASARIAWRVVNESMMWSPWQMMVEHVTTKSSYLATTRQAAQS